MSSTRITDAYPSNFKINKGIVLSKDLGCGAYSRVFTAKYREKSYAAKEIHSYLIDKLSPVKKKEIVDGYVEECYQCSIMRHSNIVQLVHIYCDKKFEFPLMIMELMDTNLASLVKRNRSTEFSVATKTAILFDVSSGLNFLHTRKIIHRDLSPNNVLLTKQLVAKIGDLGVAKAIQADSRHTKTKLIKSPGAMDFMPPETSGVNPEYSTAVDVFSFGGIALHVFTEEWPKPCNPRRKDPITKKLVVLTEIERRQEYLDTIPEGANMLKQFLKRCLDDDPYERPTTQEVYDWLNKLKTNESAIQELTTHFQSAKVSNTKEQVAKPGNHSVLQINSGQSTTTTLKITFSDSTIDTANAHLLSPSDQNGESISLTDRKKMQMKEKIRYDQARLEKGISYLKPRAYQGHQIKRAELLDEMAVKLLRATIDPDKYGSTLAITGAAGFGKTTIVTLLCHHMLVKEKFTDGFVFIELGPQATDPKVKLKKMYELLSKEKIDHNVLEQTIKEITRNYYRNLLVIIDDVWHVEDVAPLLKAFSNCKTIITTRINDINQFIPSKQLIIIGAMKENEAVSLLTSGVIDVRRISQEDSRLICKLAQDVYLWPLLLSLIRGQLEHYVKRECIPISSAIENVQAELHQKGLTAFAKTNDDEDPTDRKYVANTCIETTLRLLPKSLTDKYKSLLSWLGIGTSIHTNVLSDLWNISKQEAETTIYQLWCYGLVKFTDTIISPNGNKQNCIEVHHVISQYIIENTDSEEFILLSPSGKLGTAESMKMALKRAFQKSYGVQDLSKLSCRDYLIYIQSEIENVLLPFHIKLINNHVVTDPHGLILTLKNIKNVLQSSSNSLDLPTEQCKEAIDSFNKEIDSLIDNCKQLLKNASTTCRKISQSIQKCIHEKKYDVLIQNVKDFIKNYDLYHVAVNSVTTVRHIMRHFKSGQIPFDIRWRYEQLQIVTPNNHYFTLMMLPVVRLFIKHHKLIFSSLHSGSPNIKNTYDYILSDECAKEFDDRDTYFQLRHQEFAPILSAYKFDSHINNPPSIIAHYSPSPCSNNCANFSMLQHSENIPEVQALEDNTVEPDLTEHHDGNKLSTLLMSQSNEYFSISGMRSKYQQPPPLPAIHIARKNLLTEIATKLLQATTDCNKDEVTITVTGGGGYGKTTIVQSLCHHPHVKEHFTDGFIFIELGQQATDPKIKLREIYKLLTDKKCKINNVEQSMEELTRNYYRNLLVIIDDVWYIEDALPFVRAFSCCKTILTTRQKGIEKHIPSKQTVTVGPMTKDEAISLLTMDVIDSSQLLQEDNSRLLNELAQDVHLWPLLLSLVRGQLSHYLKTRQFSCHTAIKTVQANLHSKGLTALDVNSSHKFAVNTCINMTFQLLSKPLSNRIKTLVLWTGIGSSLQSAVLKNLWNICNQEAEDSVNKLWAYGLIQFTDITVPPNSITQHCVEVHALISQYIIDGIDSSEAYALSPIIGKINVVESVYKELKSMFLQQSYGVQDLSSLTAIDTLKYTLLEIENIVLPFSFKQINLYIVNDPYIVILKLKEIKDNLIRSPDLLSKVDVEINSLMTECKEILNHTHKLCRDLNQTVQRNLHEKNFTKLIQILEQFICNYPLCNVALKATTMVENKIIPYCRGEQLNYITIRYEGLQLMGPHYHEVITVLLPEIKKYSKLHEQIKTSLPKGSRFIEETHRYLKSGKHMLKTKAHVKSTKGYF